MGMEVSQSWLEPTWFIDSDSEPVQQFTDAAVGELKDPVEQARALFYAVRDGIRYNPYAAGKTPESFRASTVAATDNNWCVPKSVLMVAAARRCGIPARLGFADVVNHLTSAKLSDSMETDVFAWHGYAELLLNDHWVKLSTAFNRELCEKFGTKTLEFDSDNGALMHPFDESGNRHMEYINERGSFDDLPLDEIFQTFSEIYPDWSSTADGDSADQAERDTAFDG